MQDVKDPLVPLPRSRNIFSSFKRVSSSTPIKTSKLFGFSDHRKDIPLSNSIKGVNFVLLNSRLSSACIIAVPLLGVTIPA